MNIAIFGLGLIGGSIGRSIIKNTDNVVYGFDVSEDSLLKAKMLKAINHVLTLEDYGKIDMVIVATNPRIAINIIKEISPKLKDGTVIVDCCGNKRIVVDEMKKLAKAYPKIKYYGGHPMAGREFSGIAHSTGNLLDRAFFILVTVNGDIKTTASLKAFWISLGCLNVVITDSSTHDEIISYTSQLAHVVSSAYIKNPLSQKHVGYSAGSFRDMTRVAKLEPTMWAELMIENRDNLSPQIDDLINNLQQYKNAIDSGNEELLKELLQKGNALKESAEKSRKNGVNND